MTEVRKINLRLPDEVLALAADQAHRMGVSTNTYILMAIRNFIPYQEKLLQRQVVPPLGMALQGGSTRAKVKDMPKVGRNDLCPCGSGQKYKFCHGT